MSDEGWVSLSASHADLPLLLFLPVLQLFKLNLVLFTDALLHLMRCSRLMAMARGSGLLVGVGGSGKQSLARLAAYINGATTFQITVTKVGHATRAPVDILMSAVLSVGMRCCTQEDPVCTHNP